jgi:hypothetical protein
MVVAAPPPPGSSALDGHAILFCGGQSRRFGYFGATEVDGVCSDEVDEVDDVVVTRVG